MGWFLVNWLTTAVALGAVAWILPGVTIASLPALAVAAVVLGIVNAIVKPVLVVLTLPLTVMTLGVFYLIVNGVALRIRGVDRPRLRGRRTGVGDAGGGAGRPGVDVHRRLPAAAVTHADRRHRRDGAPGLRIFGQGPPGEPKLHSSIRRLGHVPRRRGLQSRLELDATQA